MFILIHGTFAMSTLLVQHLQKMMGMDQFMQIRKQKTLHFPKKACWDWWLFERNGMLECLPITLLLRCSPVPLVNCSVEFHSGSYFCNFNYSISSTT